MRALLQDLRTDRRGLTVVEYVLIAGLLSIVAVSLMSTVGTSVKNVFSMVNNSLTSA